MGYRIFAVNPGSTSTKIALFEDERIIYSANVSHNAAELAEFPELMDQLAYRKQTIEALLSENGISLQGLDACVGRGGGLIAMAGGTYLIDEQLLDHARRGANGIIHPAQLGSVLADQFCREYGGKGYVVNPPDVDEYQDLARMTGIKDIERSSHIHSLNQKETAIRHSKLTGRRYTESNYIVCHLGGGISVAAHCRGRMIDGTDIVEGEGPMAPTRAGALPAVPLIRLCYSGRYSEREMLAKCMKNGGLVDHLGTSDALEVSRRAADGDRYAQFIWEAMIYQINKSIGAMAAVLHGRVDGILLGGGLAHNHELVAAVTDACSFIAEVSAYPGEFEMEAMASGVLRVLNGEEEVKVYTGEPIWKGFV